MKGKDGTQEIQLTHFIGKRFLMTFWNSYIQRRIKRYIPVHANM